jgi:hypothetical protein
MTLPVLTVYSVEWLNDTLMMNWKGFGRNCSWPNQGSILEFSWRDPGKARKP